MGKTWKNWKVLNYVLNVFYEAVWSLECLECLELELFVFGKHTRLTHPFCRHLKLKGWMNIVEVRITDIYIYIYTYNYIYNYICIYNIIYIIIYIYIFNTVCSVIYELDVHYHSFEHPRGFKYMNQVWNIYRYSSISMRDWVSWPLYSHSVGLW